MAKYWRKKSRRGKISLTKRVRGLFKWQLVVPAVLLAFFGILFVALPILRIRSLAFAAQEDARYLKDGIILQDFPQIQRGVTRLKEDVVALEKETSRLGWLSVVPFVRAYYLDLDAGLEASRHLLSAAEETVMILSPMAETLGFRTETSSIVAVGGQERLAGIVKAMPVIAEEMQDIKSDLASAGEAVTRIDPKRYPVKIGGLEVRSAVTTARSSVLGLAESSPDLEVFLNTIPRLTGSDRKYTYLVLFQNDKEIRPTGGFWTAYALLGVEEGRLVSAQSGDMYFLDIDNRVSYYPPAPEPIAKYLKLDKWYIRDSNLSPDFKSSVETMLEFWDRVPGVPDVDGVIALDTYFVEELLDVLGEVTIPGYGEPFSSENVVYQLEVYSNVLMKHSGVRKDILGSLMGQMIAQIFALPSGSYDDLASVVIDLLGRKHILLYFLDEEAQQLAETYLVAGRIRDYTGDYLHINDSNFGGRKANWYLEERVTKNVYQEKGEWLCDLTIEYENTGDYNSEWNTGYRDYVRIYVPSGATLINGSGGLEPFSSFNDLGKTVFATFLGVDPKQTTTLKLTYKLPADVVSGKGYRLLIQKQPGTGGFEYEVNLGRNRKSLLLHKDTEIIFDM